MKIQTISFGVLGFVTVLGFGLILKNQKGPPSPPEAIARAAGARPGLVVNPPRVQAKTEISKPASRGAQPIEKNASEDQAVRSRSALAPEKLPLPQRQLAPPEVQSVTTFLKEIRRAVGSNSAPEQLYRELEGLQLQPRKSISTNHSTGDLITVRAQAPLPGVRYFHAQFMSDGEGSAPVAQHISFEIRPSADGMSIAKKLASEIFTLNIAPTVETENYVEWNRNGRTLWIRKMIDLKTLKSDLFNARDKSDLGLVMVALELDPHAHEKD